MIDLLYTWVEKIKSNNAIDVTDLYHQDGLLLGTFSNFERKGKEQILDYFNELFSLKIDVRIKTKHVHKTKSLFTVSGLYDFTVENKQIEARYSFIFLKVDHTWKIILHHSSLKPKKK
tara:strand:+ start:414 stop:767 length:354 start_codon:yes stop_codon:yes gene_type:complete